MENRISFYLYKLAFITTIIMAGTSLNNCNDDDLRASFIRFDKETQSAKEGSETKIMLTLDKPAYRSCYVRIKLETNAVYGDHFTSSLQFEDGAMVLPIEKGQKSASFNIQSIDNNLFDNGKFILFTLTKPTDGLVLGVGATSILIVDDDEGPSVANFEYERMAIGETESFVIEIPLSVAARGEGSITVSLTPRHAFYGQRFTTIPVAVNNSITIPISANTTSASIIFTPIDDELFTGNFEVLFSITAVSGVLQKGSFTELPLLVGDNEQPSIASFASGGDTVAEQDGEGIPIKIAFSSPVPGTGTVSVKFSDPSDFGGIYGRDFVTIPPAYGNTVTLPVAFHDESVSFKVLPIDNSNCGYRSATMVITGYSGAITADDGSASSLTIIDDDAAIVTFEQANASVVESNTSGIKVQLNFSKPAVENAILLITGPAYAEPEYLYGTVYVTNPPMDWDWYDLYAQVPVQKGETSASFTILPINNNIDNPEPVLVFQMAYGSDVCYIADGNYTLTIKDDD